MRLLIKGASLPDGRVRDIFIEDGKIAEISTTVTRQADRTIDGRDRVALPSLINGHTHAAMTLLRGYADDMPLKQWLEEKIWVLESKMTEEDVYWGTKLACLEMIKSGTTVFNDMYWFWEASARATRDMGMRGILSGVFIDMFDQGKAEEQIRANMELFKIAGNYSPWVTFALGPHAVYTVSKESLGWVRDFSEETGALIHMHLCETEAETDFTRERYGLSPVEFLSEQGVLSERFVGAHGCWLSETDAAILSESGASLVNAPISNLKLSVGKTLPYELVQGKGIPFCLGTDGCSSNNHLDMFGTMKFASLLAKLFTDDPTFLPARATFETATSTAARIFGLGRWEIEEGAATDIILIDKKRPEFVPGFDIYSDLVYAANGYAVDTVISMGRVLMENRHVEGEEEIMEAAGRAARNLCMR
jgi:5-methylthioadenosine/S-adenosylhomocysteine deaminase